MMVVVVVLLLLLLLLLVVVAGKRLSPLLVLTPGPATWTPDCDMESQR